MAFDEDCAELSAFPKLPEPVAHAMVAPPARANHSRSKKGDGSFSQTCINLVLTDDCLRAILSKLEKQSEKDTYGLVCKRWLHLQSTERRRMAARAGPFMLERLAVRFTSLVELDYTQDKSRSFFPGVTDADLRMIAAHFHNLERINLQECKAITDAGLASLSKGIPGLRWVHLSDCKKITDAGIISLASECSKLQGMSLARCKLVSDKGIEVVARSCRELEFLDVTGCIYVTDMGIQAVSQGCSKLQALNLSKCVSVGDVGVESIAQFCLFLRSLALQDCSRVTDVSIAALAQSCKVLEKLDLRGCRKLSNVGVSAVSRGCGATLMELSLEWSPDINDEGIIAVLQQCQVLRRLDLQSVPITNHAMDGLEVHGSSLRELRLKHCTEITAGALEKVAKWCPNLELLEVKHCSPINHQEIQFPCGCKVLL